MQTTSNYSEFPVASSQPRLPAPPWGSLHSRKPGKKKQFHWCVFGSIPGGCIQRTSKESRIQTPAVSSYDGQEEQLLLTAELYKRVQPWNRISLPFVWLLVAIHGSLTRLNRWECHHSLPILRNSCCIWFIVGWLVELLWVCHSGNQAQTTQILMWLLDEYVGCWSRPFCYLGQKLCNKRKRVILKPTCGPNQIHIH